MKKVYSALIILFICVVLLESMLEIYDKRDSIIRKASSAFNINLSVQNYTNADDQYWAKEILNGGYILHFRHAERDKWIDVQMYDALESDVHEFGKDGSRFAENEYFSKAVCLNERGKVQAKAIGEHLTNIELPINVVISSVSCRARQTANLAFGGFTSQHRILVHTGPYNEEPNDRLLKIKKFYLALPHSETSNTIVSAHNGVIQCKMFENCAGKELSLEEGGFYVISVRNNKLYLEHEFHNFRDFQRIFYQR